MRERFIPGDFVKFGYGSKIPNGGGYTYSHTNYVRVLKVLTFEDYLCFWIGGEHDPFHNQASIGKFRFTTDCDATLIKRCPL